MERSVPGWQRSSVARRCGATLALAAVVVALLGGCGAPSSALRRLAPEVYLSTTVPTSTMYAKLTPSDAQAMLPFHLVIPNATPPSLTLDDIRVQIAPLPRGETPSPHSPPRHIATLLYRSGNGRPDVGLQESLLDLRPPATGPGQPPLHNPKGTLVPVPTYSGTQTPIAIHGASVLRTTIDVGGTAETTFTWQRGGVFFSLMAPADSGVSSTDVEQLVAAAIP